MLKTIRLELARCKAYPEGDPSHAYVFRAPLDGTGYLDVSQWRETHELCTVHRFERWQEVETGTLRRTRGGRWVFSYNPGDDSDEAIFSLSKHLFNPGEYISITEHDGNERTFRVAWVHDWHPGPGSQPTHQRQPGGVNAP